jgi:DNA-binding transcriptional LysR family regulator
MELSDLLMFKTVVEEGGIVRAAHKLHRVPSGVTTRIQQLERSIGAQLFLRDKQRLHLTPSGEVLLSYAGRLLQLSAQALGAVSGGPLRGALRLGALESTSASRLPQVLAAFHRTHPDVSIELRTGTNDAMTEAVAQRRLDAAFVAEVPAGARLDHLPVFRERLSVISSLDHAPIRSPDDVAADSLIAFSSGCAYRRVMQRWLGPRRLAGTRILELASYHAMVACVAAGTGIALVPDSVLATLQHLHVSSHRLPRVLAELTTPLIWHAEDPSPAVAALREVLQGLVPKAARASPASRAPRVASA